MRVEQIAVLPWDEVRRRLRIAIYADGNQKDFAARMGVSPAFVSAVLAGRKSPTPAMLALIGARRVAVYAEAAP